MKNRNAIRQFGRKIKEKRAALGITQEDLAELSGLHRTYISGVERGERNPTIDIVFSVAKALKCPVSDLLGGVDK